MQPTDKRTGVNSRAPDAECGLICGFDELQAKKLKCSTIKTHMQKRSGKAPLCFCVIRPFAFRAVRPFESLCNKAVGITAHKGV